MIDRRLLRVHRTATVLLALVVGAGALGALLLVGQTWLLALAIDGVFLGGAGLGDVLPLLAGAAALLLGRSVAAAAGEVLAQRAASRIKGGLRARLAAALFALGPTFTRNERAGELVSTLGEGVEGLDEYITQYTPAFFLAVINPLLIFAAVLLLDPATTLILLFAGPMLVLLLALIGGQAQRLTQQRFAELSWMSAFFLDLLQGLPTLKLFGRSQEQAANIERISRRYGDTTLQVLATAFQSSLVMEWAATAATAMVALEVSLRLVAGSIAFAPGLAVLLLTPEFFLPLRQLAIKYHAGAAGKAAGERIFGLLAQGEAAARQPLTPGAGDETAPLPAPSPAILPATPAIAAPAIAPVQEPARTFAAGDIRFDHVACTYPTAPAAGASRGPALLDVSFVLPAGQTTALVGPSGAGKSSAANLLLRFLEPDAGAIYAGDRPLASIDPAHWRRQVAWVPQHAHLFAGTVAANIALGRPEASRAAVIAAARAAHADEFIRALPQGYDTPLGEGAARLSGGERQRIAIARAVLQDAPLLILDEASANLDAESEALIAGALARLMQGRTVLLIAHRPQLAAAASQVIVLEGGSVVEAGPPSTLLAGDTRFRRQAIIAGGGAFAYGN